MMDVLKECNKSLLFALLEFGLLYIFTINLLVDKFAMSFLILFLMKAISDDFEKMEIQKKWMK